MKRLHLLLLLATVSVFAAGETGAEWVVATAQVSQSQSCGEAVQSGASGERLAQQGCCKGQKGVCGCRAGKIVCCDGKFSEGCTCNRDEAPSAVH